MIFISGNGTNLQAIINAIENFKLNAKITKVISNNNRAYGLKRAQQYKIPTEVVLKENFTTREEYDQYLAQITTKENPDLVVLAGWMHIFTDAFLKPLQDVQIINLHPALPGMFPGKQAIKDAWVAYVAGEIKETGIMIHHVTSVVDVGDVVLKKTIPIRENDTFNTLKERIQQEEKPLLLSAINTILYPYNIYYKGKVCDIYKLNSETLAFAWSDRARYIYNSYFMFCSKCIFYLVVLMRLYVKFPIKECYWQLKMRGGLNNCKFQL